jgi:exopolyphosphatase/guanosine-5'-triphosphate,3'-diphosphate pyrophosphatase
MRAAAIDIGTNSILLLVAERRPDGSISPILETVEITRLGAGVDASGNLRPDAISRSLDVLRGYAQTLRELAVDRRAAVGTSALRDAGNGTDFTKPARALLGCPIEIVSGTREASLVQRGVGSTFRTIGRADVIFDVGGGSTEFVVGGEPPRQVSLNLGTVRLTERLIVSDPPAANELDAVGRAISDELEALALSFRRLSSD